MASIGLRPVVFLPAQVNVASNVGTISVGLILPNYGPGRQFRIYAFLRLQQLGAGGYRFRFTGIGAGSTGLRQQFDPDVPAMTFNAISSGVSQFTFTPTGNSIGQMRIEIQGAIQIGTVELQFGQQTSDVNASSILFGSYMEAVVI